MATSLVPKIGAVGTLAQYQQDSSGNVTGLVGPDGVVYRAIPPAESMLESYGSTAYDITLASVTPISTAMTLTKTAEMQRHSPDTLKIVSTADTGCEVHWVSANILADPTDLMLSFDIYVADPLLARDTTRTMTVTLSNDTSLATRYSGWVFGNAALRQGWNTIKLWAGDDYATTTAYRESNLNYGVTHTKFGTGFDFSEACNYFSIRFTNMNGRTFYVDQIRKPAKAKTKIVLGFDATGYNTGDTTFVKSLAPMLQNYNIPSYFTVAHIYSGDRARAVTLYNDWGWDAIGHSWNHGATVPGGDKLITLARAGDVVTVTYAAEHGYTIGRRFRATIYGAETTNFNGTFWMTPTTTTQVTYTAVGAEATTTGTTRITTLLSDVFTTVDDETQGLINREIVDVKRIMENAGLRRGANCLAWPNNSSPEYTQTVKACKSAGVVLCRGSRYGTASMSEFGVDNPIHIGSFALESSATLYSTVSMLKKKIAGAIGRGDSVLLFGHWIIDETDPDMAAYAAVDLEYPPGKGGNPAPPAVGEVNADGGFWYLGSLRNLIESVNTDHAGVVEWFSFPQFAGALGYDGMNPE